MSHELSPEALSIIEKVQKLLALAGNNPNEAEAASASAKAMELLQAYNLDMTTLERHSGKSGKREAKFRAGGLYPWQRDLWYAVSKLHFCMYWFQRGLNKGDKYQHKIVGRRENVVAAELMAQYLQDTIERMARARVGNYPPEFFTRSNISYRDGIAARLARRLWDMRNQKLAEEKAKREEARHRAGYNPNALMLADAIESEEDANLDFLYGKPEGYHAQQRVERKLRQEAAQAAFRAEEERLAKWARENPEAAAALAKQAADKAARDAKEEAKRAARRKGAVTTGPKFKGDIAAYYEGHAAGASIGLDTQVASNTVKERLT